MDTVRATLATFCRDLRLSSFRTTHDLAISAAKLFRALPISTFDEATSKLIAAYPHPVLESLSSRILHIKQSIKDIRTLTDAMDEVIDDVIEGCEHIASLGASLIQPGDVTLAFATDELALKVIRVASNESSESKFSVTLIVAHDKSMEELTKSIKMPSNVSLRFTSDSSPASELRRTSKVLLSAEVLCFDGTVVAQNGAAVIASAARRAAVPLVVLAPLYSLAIRESTLVAGMKNESGNPGSIWEYEKVCLKRSGAGMLRVLNPKWDFVKVDLVVTERGGFCPAYIGKVGEEIYGTGKELEA